MLMQTSMGEEEKEADDSQEFPTEAVALVRGLIDSDYADGKVRASQIYVDDGDSEVDVSDHDGGEQGTSKTIPGSLLEDGGSPGQGRPPLPCTPLRICREKLCLLKIRLVHRSRIIMGLKKGTKESGRKQKMIRIMKLLMNWVKK